MQRTAWGMVTAWNSAYGIFTTSTKFIHKLCHALSVVK
jgi:hypothetical protein